VKVRLAAAHDFEAVAALLEELGRPRVTEETRDGCLAMFERQLADSSAAHLVAEDEGAEVVGFCSLHFRDRLNYPTPDAWVPDLIVTESARRRGAGRALLEEAERRARERGCWLLALESAHHRTEAHAFYRAFEMTDAAKAFAKLLG
jgi:GNAT superfamily N-acetyltransferase